MAGGGVAGTGRVADVARAAGGADRRPTSVMSRRTIDPGIIPTGIGHRRERPELLSNTLSFDYHQHTPGGSLRHIFLRS